MQAPSTQPPKPAPKTATITSNDLRTVTLQLARWRVSAKTDQTRREMDDATRRLQRITRRQRKA